MTQLANSDSETNQQDFDRRFLQIAEEVSRQSPDPATKHGCVIVDADRRVISTGYNAPVEGIPIELVPLDRPRKYAWFVHAEDRAVTAARRDLSGATAYVTGEPCAACVRRFLQAGVRRIVHGGRTSGCLDEYESTACKAMAKALGAEIVQIGT